MQHLELAPLSDGKEASDSVSTIAEEDEMGAAAAASGAAAPLPERPSGAGSTFSDKYVRPLHDLMRLHSHSWVSRDVDNAPDTQ